MYERNLVSVTITMVHSVNIGNYYINDIIFH